MRPRRTPQSNVVWRLEGGTEDNDLWAEQVVDEGGNAVITSVWDLTSAEREAIADGANLELLVWSPHMPPVAMGVTTQPIGRSKQQ